MSKLAHAARRLTKKQRQKRKRILEAEHKRFMRRGVRGTSNPTDRPVRSGESPRQRHERELREREEARRAARRAEHEVIAGKHWVVVTACVGQGARLVAKLREAGIPYLRAQDEVVQVVSGRVRKLTVPIQARTIFVGVDSRGHLEQLAMQHPWLMERIPGERHHRLGDVRARDARRARFDRACVGDPVARMPGETLPWMVDRAERISADSECGSVTALVPESQMRRFADSLVDATPRADGESPFEIGEHVKVAEGPFASFGAVVEEVDIAAQRLKAAVSIFGRATPVELDFSQVSRA